jgi:NRPS condensation-like uncharacterized protein
MVIRYGRITNGEVEWFEVSHCECDGIGGFARLLRKQGLNNLAIPQTKHSCRGIFSPLWNLFCSNLKKEVCAKRSDWIQPALSTNITWHLFTKSETQEILAHCRVLGVTVNSYLLHTLDQAIRPEVRQSEKKIPWMIPVNLRGDVCYPDDTQNHVSCVEVKIANEDTPAIIHRKILHQLQLGEHRALHLLLKIGRIFTHQVKVNLLTKDRNKSTGIIGAFSNLGAWKSEEVTTEEGWVFCPPVVKEHLLGAGCVTYQGRLGLATQSYSEKDKVEQRMQRWVRNIGEPCLRPAC